MLDEALVEALADVVAEAGQPKSVAQRLIAWLEALSKSEPSLDANTQALINVHNALDLGAADAD